MHRDKVASRILLILSVVHVAAAAPAIIRQRSLEVNKKVTPALEKRANLDDETSHHFPRMDNNLPSTSGTLPSQGDMSSAPGDPQLHSDSPPELGTPQLHMDHPPTSGTPQLQVDLAPAPGGPPSQEDSLLAYGTPQLHNDQPLTPGAPPSSDDTLPGFGILQSQDETSPASGDPQLHSGPPPELGTLQSHIDRPPTSGTPQLQDDMPGTPPSEDDMSELSTSRTLHSEPPRGAFSLDDAWRAFIQAGLRGEVPGGETALSEGDMSESSATRTLQYHNDNQPPTRGASLSEDDQWRTWIQAALRGESSYEGSPLYLSSETSSKTLEGPQSQNDSPRSEIPQLYELSPLYLSSETSSPSSGGPQFLNDPPPASGTPQLQDDGSDDFFSWYRQRLQALRVIQHLPFPPDFDSETPLHLEAPWPLDSETPLPLHSETLQPLHSETPPSLHSETPPLLHSETLPPLHSETPPHLLSETPPPLHSEAPSPLNSETLQPLESEALPSAPETHTLFNDAVRHKLKTYGVVGAVAGVSVGLAFGVKKLIDDHSHGSQRAGRDLASSGVVGRGTNMHPRPRKNPVSRAPAKSRDEDLRLLSILTRRALERLD